MRAVTMSMAVPMATILAATEREASRVHHVHVHVEVEVVDSPPLLVSGTQPMGQFGPPLKACIIRERPLKAAARPIPPWVKKAMKKGMPGAQGQGQLQAKGSERDGCHEGACAGQPLKMLPQILHAGASARAELLLGMLATASMLAAGGSDTVRPRGPSGKYRRSTPTHAGKGRGAKSGGRIAWGLLIT